MYFRAQSVVFSRVTRARTMGEGNGNRADAMSGRVAGQFRAWSCVLRALMRCARPLVPLIVLASAAAASGKDPDLHQFRDWTLHRSGETCRMVSSVISKRSGALLLEASFQHDSRDRSEGGLVAAIRVPLGVHLPAGIAVRHAGDGPTAIGLEWITCDAFMCTAAGRFSAEAVSRLRRARSVHVGFRPMQNARPVNIELSLMGFTDASRAMAGCR